MGLTIHYTLRLAGEHSAAEVKTLVARARAFALENAIQEATPLIRVEPDFIMGIHWLPQPDTPDGFATCAEVPPQAGWVFSVQLGEGCERLLLGLCRYPATVTYQGRVLRTRVDKGWRLSFFCKTQYASVHGWENFLRCHRTAIDLLQFWRTLGVQVRIIDEGGYWPRRSETTLRSKLDEMNGIVAAMAGALKDSPGVGGRPLLTEAPILKHPRFEHLEHDGVQRYGAKIAQAVRAIRQTLPTAGTDKT